MGTTAASVWGDIFHHPYDEAVLDDTLSCVRLMHSEWDGLSGWMGFRKVCPGIRLCNGMQFPNGATSGNCIPFRTGILGHGFRMQKGHMTWPSAYICTADVPMTSRVSTPRRLPGDAECKVHREFRTSRRALNVLSVRAGLPEQAMLPHTPAQVRRDHDSLTIGAKPFISFLVWPVFSN